jgi:hypothetical protein
MKRAVAGQPLRRAAAALAVLLGLAGGLAPQRASAQVLPATLGLVGGFVGGTYITAGVYVFKSRATGWTLHGTEDVLSIRPELLPLAVMPIAGAWLGYQSPKKLAAAGTWGGVGLLAGAAIGAGFGQLIWGTNEGRWAGGTIASAAGLAIGAIIGALTYRESSDENPRSAASAPFVTFTIPLGGR